MVLLPSPVFSADSKRLSLTPPPHILTSSNQRLEAELCVQKWTSCLVYFEAELARKRL